MDLLKKHKTADALAAVGFIIAALTRSKVIAVIAFVILFSNALGLKTNHLLVDIWDKITHVIGRVVTTVLLTVIFFLFFTPLAWLYRKFNKNSVEDFFGKKPDTYFKTVRDSFPPQLFEKMW